MTPVSIERPWLWFEIGASWSKGRSDECKIYPVCAPEIGLGDLPSPLDRLQALSLGKGADLKLLFRSLINQFRFGKISSLPTTNITRQIPKYKDVTVSDVDSNERVSYTGPYLGYSDVEIMEVIITRLFEPDEERFRAYSSLYTQREDIIHNGKLIHFHDVDRTLSLPPGSARRLLNTVAEMYGLFPVMSKRISCGIKLLGNAIRLGE